MSVTIPTSPTPCTTSIVSIISSCLSVTVTTASLPCTTSTVSSPCIVSSFFNVMLSISVTVITASFPFIASLVSRVPSCTPSIIGSSRTPSTSCFGVSSSPYLTTSIPLFACAIASSTWLSSSSALLKASRLADVSVTPSGVKFFPATFKKSIRETTAPLSLASSEKEARGDAVALE